MTYVKKVIIVLATIMVCLTLASPKLLKKLPESKGSDKDGSNRRTGKFILGTGLHESYYPGRGGYFPPPGYDCHPYRSSRYPHSNRPSYLSRRLETQEE
jgi:hypothetical protein